MIPIKVRAWDNNENKMISEEDLVSFIRSEPVQSLQKSFIMGNLIVMQFTGLHDLNGKEIYEGDSEIDRLKGKDTLLR